MKNRGNNFSRLVVTFISRSSISSTNVGIFLAGCTLLLAPSFALASTHHKYRHTVQTQTTVSPTVVPSTVVTSTPTKPAATTTVVVATPAPIASVTAPVTLVQSGSTSQLCMNYGHQPTVSGQYDMTQVDTNLATMKASGINCLRLAYNGFNNPGSEALALHAQSQGFYVILGGDWGTLDPSQLASYDAQVLTEAKWAQQNNIPQMALGNEQESRLSGLTQAQWDAHIVQLAAQVRQVYSGKISYEINSDYLPGWEQNGLGALDLLGLNVYCGEGCNADRIASAIQTFGVSHVYVSETNADMDTGRFSSDQAHALEVQQDLLVLMKTFPIKFYYFNFISGSGAASDWGLFDGTTLSEPLTAAALGIK